MLQANNTTSGCVNHKVIKSILEVTFKIENQRIRNIIN